MVIARYGVFFLVCTTACSNESTDSPGSTPDAGAGGSAGVAGSAGANCDPRPGKDSDASSGGSGGSGGTLVVDGGGIDLDGGEPPPVGRYKCWDADSGAGFMCEQFGMECCTKKDVCYEPAVEPSFCNRPYCD